MPTGKFVYKNAYIAINGTSLADHCSSITAEDSAEEIDFTSFTASGYKEIGQGMKDVTVTATFFQDYASGSVHSILYPLYQSGGTFQLVVGPDATTQSATNPRGTMTARIYSYGGLGGAVGEAASFEASFRNAGTAGLVIA